jgi:hypothetical protein
VYVTYIYATDTSKNIANDRDPKIFFFFWKTLFRFFGTILAPTIHYHPQTTRQIEIMSKCLEGHLRNNVKGKQASWPKWLLLTKNWYNTTYHTSIGLMSFKAFYSDDPPFLIDLIIEDTRLPIIRNSLRKPNKDEATKGEPQIGPRLD